MLHFSNGRDSKECICLHRKLFAESFHYLSISFQQEITSFVTGNLIYVDTACALSDLERKYVFIRH